jgi:hypothetical protein
MAGASLGVICWYFPFPLGLFLQLFFFLCFLPVVLSLKGDQVTKTRTLMPRKADAVFPNSMSFQVW